MTWLFRRVGQRRQRTIWTYKCISKKTSSTSGASTSSQSKVLYSRLISWEMTPHPSTQKLHSHSHQSHITSLTSIWTSHRASLTQGRPTELSMFLKAVPNPVTAMHALSNQSSRHWRTFKTIRVSTELFRKTSSKVLKSRMTLKCIVSREGSKKEDLKVIETSRNRQTAICHTRGQR